jgi:hypothetical protein
MHLFLNNPIPKFTIFLKGLNDRTAAKICSSIGYQDGVIMNVQGLFIYFIYSGKIFPKFCLDFKGENYCGS